jgi:hypothetical protein
MKRPLLLILAMIVLSMTSISCGSKKPPLPSVEVKEAEPYSSEMQKKLELNWGSRTYEVGSVSDECRESVDSGEMEVGPSTFRVDMQGNIYIDDIMNRRYIKYDSDGKFVGSVGHERFNDAIYMEAESGYLYAYDENSIIYRYSFEEDSLDELRFSSLKSGWSLFLGSVQFDESGNVYLLGRDWNRATDSPKILCKIDAQFSGFTEERELPIEDWLSINRIDSQGNLYFLKWDKANPNLGTAFKIDAQNNVSQACSFDLNNKPIEKDVDEKDVFFLVNNELEIYYFLSCSGEVLQKTTITHSVPCITTTKELYCRINRTANTDDESLFRIYKVYIDWKELSSI